MNPLFEDSIDKLNDPEPCCTEKVTWSFVAIILMTTFICIPLWLIGII